MAESAKAGRPRDHYQTPRVIWERVKRLGEVGLDPCAHPDSTGYADAGEQWPAQGGRWCGLFRSWAGHGLVYAFPPASRIDQWAAKLAAEGADTEVVALLPAWPEQRWFHDHIWTTATAICWWRGLVGLVGASRPEPVAIAYWGGRVEQFAEVFGEVGVITRSEQVLRPAAWTITIARTAPLGAWQAKHAALVPRVIALWKREIAETNQRVACPPARSQRTVTVTRYGALFTSRSSVARGGELVVSALEAAGLVSAEAGYDAEHKQAIDRLHQRTEITITEAAT